MAVVYWRPFSQTLEPWVGRESSKVEAVKPKEIKIDVL